MTEKIARIVALTCYGNAFLQGTDVGELFPKNLTCMFYDHVPFMSVEKWFRFLKTSNAIGIRLSWAPRNALLDCLTVGLFGSGGPWTLEVLLPKNRSEFWIARHVAKNWCARDNLAYCRISKRATKKSKLDDLQINEARLRQALREIYSFSTRCCCGWSQVFEDALDILDSGKNNLNVYYADLAPAGQLSDRARTLLDACQRAWVFGGMGSWNDLLFDGDDEIEYRRVSDQLFHALHHAIAAAANDSYYRLG